LQRVKDAHFQNDIRHGVETRRCWKGRKNLARLSAEVVGPKPVYLKTVMGHRVCMLLCIALTVMITK
jgi:hypothetical protein